MWFVKWRWDGAVPDDPAWRKKKDWRGGGFAFRREYSGALYVTEEQNQQLLAVEANCLAVQEGVCAQLAKNIIGQPWDDRLVLEALAAVRQNAADQGLRGATTGFVSADRIAVRTAQRCRDRHRRILPPRDYEAHPTFRLAAGELYKSPVEVERVENVRDAVRLGDVGLVYAEGRASDAWASCAYAEVARMGESWHARFIWATAVEKRGKNDERRENDDG